MKASTVTINGECCWKLLDMEPDLLLATIWRCSLCESVSEGLCRSLFVLVVFHLLSSLNLLILYLSYQSASGWVVAVEEKGDRQVT